MVKTPRYRSNTCIYHINVGIEDIELFDRTKTLDLAVGVTNLHISQIG